MQGKIANNEVEGRLQYFYTAMTCADRLDQMQENHYGEQFYGQQIEGSLQSARIYMSYLFSHWKPEKVVDVGCGRGAWLAACHELGATRLVGFDGDWIKPDSLLDPAIDFRPSELEKPIASDERYDLALSLEVAEHLRAESSNTFVDSLANLADAIVFSAAFSAQPGTNHINTNLHSFWAAKFQSKGYFLFDLFRPTFWSKMEVEPWYRQNTFLYVKRTHPLYNILIKAGLPPLADASFADCVHPWLYHSALNEMFRLQTEIGKKTSAPITRVSPSSPIKRLNIVVPYRAREAHLQQFVPHLRAYFARDKIDREILYRVLIIEQENGLPFNRGVLNNIGFVLGREHSEYTAFHDVDYLPIWADYTFADTPTAIVWYGAEVRPIVPGRSEVIRQNMSQFFSAVLLVPNTLFEQVDGFANSYWGWGYEDMDLANRFGAKKIVRGRRMGTFHALPHVNEGIQLDLKPTPIARVNEQLFKSRWVAGQVPTAKDGLSTLAFEVLQRRSIPDGPSPERSASWEIVTVRLSMQPRTEQLAAIAGSRTTPGLQQPWNVTIKS